MSDQYTSPPPTVTAVVSTYNYARFLPAALDSIFTQEYPPERLSAVLIDDGSTDETPTVAAEYCRRYGERLRYVRQDNAGVCAATNHGLRLADGELIALLDADDMWVPGRLGRMVSELTADPQVGMVYGDLRVVDEQVATLADSYYQLHNWPCPSGRALGRLLDANFVMPTIVFRGALKAAIPPMPEWVQTQDWWIASHLAARTQLAFVPEVVTLYRRHGLNRSVQNVIDGRRLARRALKELTVRRYMLTTLRSPELTAGELLKAAEHMWWLCGWIAERSGRHVEELVSVSDEQRAFAHQHRTSGAARVAAGELTAAASHFCAATGADPLNQSGRELLRQVSWIPAAAGGS